MDFKTVLDLISVYKIRFSDDSFCKSEFFSNYHLRNYKEAIQVFAENVKRLSEERDVMGALGLAFVYMGKFDEAKSVLEKFQVMKNFQHLTKRKRIFRKNCEYS